MEFKPVLDVLLVWEEKNACGADSY
jgi:hypothetical protein